MSTTSSSSTNNSSSHFYPITKSSSVPDIHKNNVDSHKQSKNNDQLSNTDNDTNTSNNNTTLNNNAKPIDIINNVKGTTRKDVNNLLVTNSDSTESAIASPAGSLEQFEVSGFNNITLPLTPDEANGEAMKNFDNANSSNPQTKLFDTSASSFRFRRHSSQSSINVPNPSNLTLGTSASSSSANGLNNPERICSSPINSLKMSSRVCQIKISEGIEPHLNHEIKSERDMQSTLKLKSSCDDLMLSNDDYDNKDSQNRTGNNSPNTIGAPSAIFRHNSQSNMPSPSMSSCYSYSNSCSPTGGINATNNQGFQRCFSPSSASLAINNSPSLSQSQNNSNQISQNYFSQSPSPTRKLFLSRRSMSPIPCLIRPNSFSAPGSKRKFSDVEATDSNPHASPKRSNNDNQQEFVQPLLIYTGNSRSIVRSQASSPFSPLAAMPSSPNQNSISSLIITAPNSTVKMQTNADDDQKTQGSGQNNQSKTLKNDSPLTLEKSISESSQGGSSSKFLWPPVSNAKQTLSSSDETSNKYTFKPIQLPPPTTTIAPILTSNTSFQPTTSNNKNQQQSVRKLRSSNTANTTTTSTTFASLAQLNSPLNSPAQYICDDSPINYSPSVSIASQTSIAGEKPDSGYQSSIQNNSDSESCI